MKVRQPLTILMMLALATPPSFAGEDIRMTSEDVRNGNIRKGEVWSAPSWIKDEGQFFRFSNELNILRGSEVTNANDLLLLPNADTGRSEVSCLMTEDTTDKFSTGKTPKFRCNLLQTNSAGQLEEASGKGKKIKVKYGADNGEIYGELMGTRLLWALGFSADRMMFIDRLLCYGCTSNPFKDRRVDTSSLQTPREFIPAAIERKHDGEAMYVNRQVKITEAGPNRHNTPPRYRTVVHEGWGFDELMTLTSENPAEARRQKIERDALRILSSFIQHVDNKEQNQRLTCVGDFDAEGNCLGEVKLIVQDVGATFGRGLTTDNESSFLGINIAKARLEHWVRKPFWKEASACRMDVGWWANRTLKDEKATEEGRQFLVKLLEGFSAGAEGQKRVEDLFLAAQIERRSGTIPEWVAAFNKKVHELKYPMGANNPDFKCPKQLN
ncbi:hypothetical protein A11Q_2475 [Pseudobdellovibrio exovorus JSS]|uniref:Uncharacterized protein n=2 Tax=Pseudobdellovibrio exovorus TaxID=453816 RepID=M4VF64_9BACT|nr:hypothetical protein A11Q_2475 [Pseudobdellovibrio exovorus JSS]